MPSRASLPRCPRSLLARKDAAFEINRRLTALCPDAVCALNYSNLFELLVTAVLSTQITDTGVDTVIPRLFEAYPGPEVLIGADRLELENILHPLGFYRVKMVSCIGLVASLCTNHSGEVLRALEELVKFLGVGRKTANVILGNTFGVPGITIDTHVDRLVGRRTWTRGENPVKVETDTARLIPGNEWT